MVNHGLYQMALGQSIQCFRSSDAIVMQNHTRSTSNLSTFPSSCKFRCHPLPNFDCNNIYKSRVCLHRQSANLFELVNWNETYQIDDGIRTMSITASEPHISFTRRNTPSPLRPIQSLECANANICRRHHIRPDSGPYGSRVYRFWRKYCKHIISSAIACNSISEHLPNSIDFAARAIKNATRPLQWNDGSVDRGCRRQQRWVTDRQNSIIPPFIKFRSEWCSAYLIEHEDWALNTGEVIKILIRFEHFESMFAYCDRVAMNSRMFPVSISAIRFNVEAKVTLPHIPQTRDRIIARTIKVKYDLNLKN